MRTIDLKSLIIGVLATALIAVSIGGTSEGAQPRYQVSATAGRNLIVFDTQTNRVSLLFQRRIADRDAPDWPWACDNSFSLIDALTQPKGADVTPGPGR